MSVTVSSVYRPIISSVFPGKNGLPTSEVTYDFRKKYFEHPTRYMVNRARGGFGFLNLPSTFFFLSIRGFKNKTFAMIIQKCIKKPEKGRLTNVQHKHYLIYCNDNLYYTINYLLNAFET